MKKKFFQKKYFKKKSKPFSNTHKNSTPTKTHQPTNQTQANFRSRNHGVSHCRIWMGHHFATPRPCKQCPPAMQKCIHMNQWISTLQNVEKRDFEGSKFSKPGQHQNCATLRACTPWQTPMELLHLQVLGFKNWESCAWSNQIHEKRPPAKHRIWPQLLFGEPPLPNFYGIHKGQACKTQCQHHFGNQK